jgi:hypothetical protein
MLQQLIISIYHENKATRDPFLVQSALRELLVHFRDQNKRVGFVFDRFDDFCDTATPQMTAALRGLRDSFKGTVFYIIGMRQEAAYLSDPSSLGELYELLDTRVCWVGPMNQADADMLIKQETNLATVPPTELEVEAFLQLSGGFPALLKAICSWWVDVPDKPVLDEWLDILLITPSINHRVQEILAGLSQEELLALSEVEKLSHLNDIASSFLKLERQYSLVLDRLARKGICSSRRLGSVVLSKLLASYLATTKGRGRGRIWLEEEAEVAYQGQTILQDLTPLEREVLHFLLRHPRVRHAKTDLIANTWSNELSKEGVTDDSLYQVIAGLRRKIEPNPSKPCYILNWRGKPEGGYQLFPEGRPS